MYPLGGSMRTRILLAISILVVFGSGLWLALPARAVTDGYMRQNLEREHFPELLIRSAIYPKSTHDVFVQEKKDYVHGLPRTNLPMIYEPDVLTWELSMAAHRKQILGMPPTNDPPLPDLVSPVPMGPGLMFPGAPGQVQLTPLGDQSYYSKPLPDGSGETMDRLLQRARNAGMTNQNQFQAESIKQRLSAHMDSLGTPAPAAPNPGMGMPPLVPVLPGQLPQGRAADSYDRNY